MQLWDKKAKRDDDLSDSEDEGEGEGDGEGGQRFEKDRSMKASSSSKKPSGEVSMDISKAPSPTAESTGADVVATVTTALDSAGLLDTPGASKVGAIGDTAAPSVGGMEAADTARGTVGSTGSGGPRYESVMGDATERDVDMVG